MARGAGGLTSEEREGSTERERGRQRDRERERDNERERERDEGGFYVIPEYTIQVD